MYLLQEKFTFYKYGRFNLSLFLAVGPRFINSNIIKKSIFVANCREGGTFPLDESLTDTYKTETRWIFWKN